VSNAEETWRPFGYDGNEAEYDALHDGVPEWMAASFWKWVELSFTIERREAGYGGRRWKDFDIALLRKAERLLRFSVDYDGDTVYSGIEKLRRVIEAKGLGIPLADFLLAEGKHADSLNRILLECSSKWTVGERVSGRTGLVPRIPEGVQLHADMAMSSAGQAGKRLAQAWEQAFGIKPDPSNAYSLAVKAVEDATIPVVVPSRANATLGDVIRQLTQDGDWSLPLTREHNDAPTSSIVLRMCQALWKGHHDRHGGGQHSIPEVTPEEAETAVTLAVPLVHWFASGMVARR